MLLLKPFQQIKKIGNFLVLSDLMETTKKIAHGTGSVLGKTATVIKNTADDLHVVDKAKSVGSAIATGNITKSIHNRVIQSL